MRLMLFIILVIFPTSVFAMLPPKILNALDAQSTSYQKIADNSGKMRWYCFKDRESGEVLLVAVDNNRDGIYEMWDVRGTKPRYEGKVSEGMVGALLPFSKWYTGTVKQ